MRTTTIRYNLAELLMDIKDRVFISGNPGHGKGENGMPANGEAVDVLEDNNLALIERLIGRLMFEVMDLLYPFCKEPVKRELGHDMPENGTQGNRDNSLPEVDAYVIRLDFPYERSETEIQALKAYVHDYIVYKCQAEWMALAMPESQWQLWEHKAQETRDLITMSLVKPLKPKRLRVRTHLY